MQKASYLLSKSDKLTPYKAALRIWKKILETLQEIVMFNE